MTNIVKYNIFGQDITFEIIKDKFNVFSISIDKVDLLGIFDTEKDAQSYINLRLNEYYENDRFLILINNKEPDIYPTW